MCNKILSAEELRKTSFIPNKIELFFIKRKYNKIQKKIFEKIKDAAAEGKTQITINVPYSETEKNLYRDVLERFEFLGYEVRSCLGIYYDVAWENKEERIKNKFNEIKEEKSGKKILYPIPDLHIYSISDLYNKRPGDLAQDEKGNLFIKEKEGVYAPLTRGEWI